MTYGLLSEFMFMGDQFLLFKFIYLFLKLENPKETSKVVFKSV